MTLSPEILFSEKEKLKIDFENWYYQLGGEHIGFIYDEDYPLTPQEAAKALGVLKVTLNKYIKQGLECMDNSSRKKIPSYAIEILKDPVYAILMQKTAQEKRLRNQTPHERLAEINSEIAELQMKYGKETFEETFAGHNGDEMEIMSSF
ncbi:hypothetical protein ACFFK0_29910 [Paenibacillus chartarius]|uniref:Helix-turn-helix domain-containing protein n=1 Tax=Paenibacillus chartarius TaxID=747481 RepID=A0ABV6DVD7_9BACL